MRAHALIGVALLSSAIAATADAQTLGTFRWQLQPYCNVVTVAVVQDGGQYHLDGTDDQCGATRKASVVGLAFPNPDGTIGLGLTIVTTPGGAPVHLDARISIATVSGPWNDSAGGSGTFAFTPGAGTGGSPRPAPTAVPSSVVLLNTGTIPSGGGSRMIWHADRAAFRAGVVNGNQWDDSNIGTGSVAFGRDTIASSAFAIAMGDAATASGVSALSMGFATQAVGAASTAFGNQTRAEGYFSTALGLRSRAVGLGSTAIGEGTVASGTASFAGGDASFAAGAYSFAFGQGNTAIGYASVAAGLTSEANGDNSIALGAHAVADGVKSLVFGNARTLTGAPGSVVFGDVSSASPVVAFAPNTFVVRAAGGARFFSNAAQTLGPVLAANGTDWQAVSDVNRKHRFRELDHEDVLARLAAMPVTEWSYREQDTSIRHMGPTAQDFHAAFGLGQDPLLIGTLDADGVALAGVRALEARTRALPGDVERLRDENVTLREAVAALRREINALKRDGGQP